MTRVPRAYARWLWVLAGLFLVRVVAQPLAARTDMPLLPPFEAWHSGVVPYGVLVLVQGLILGALFFVAWTMSRDRVRPRRRLGIVLVTIGGVYFAAMAARLALGVTILRDHSWFDRPLPTVFHLVLAGFLLVCGRFHVRYGAR